MNCLAEIRQQKRSNSSTLISVTCSIQAYQIPHMASGSTYPWKFTMSSVLMFDTTSPKAIIRGVIDNANPKAVYVIYLDEDDNLCVAHSAMKPRDIKGMLCEALSVEMHPEIEC